MKTTTQDCKLTRRGFFAGSLATALTPAAFAAAAPNGFREPPRDLPVVADADLIVAGGGPAGFSAAITAARMGKKVRLFEAHGALGGIWTTGLLSCIIDFGRGDLTKEITDRLDKLGARHKRHFDMRANNYIYEPEYMKVALEQMCEEAGVRFTFHSPVVAAYRDASGRNVETVVTESKGGRRAWRAPLFMDCTGDGDLAALAGCGFDLGGGNGNADQPASLMALLRLENDAAIAPFSVNHPGYYTKDGKEAFAKKAKHALYEELVAAGAEPSYAHPTLFRLREGYYAFMANHEYGVKLDDAEAITTASVRARREVWTMTEALKRHHPDIWKGLTVIVTSEQLGHRAARRIHGRYTLTVEDLAAGKTFPAADVVSLGGFGVDVHAVNRADNRIKAAGYGNYRIKTPYQIPFGCCRAKDADNLYMAGRCISGDFASQASYRVTGPAVEMAEGVVRKLFGRGA